MWENSEAEENVYSSTSLASPSKMAKITYGEPVDISDSGVSRAIEEEPVGLPGQAMDLNLAKEKRDKNKNAVNKIASLQLEDETAKHTRVGPITYTIHLLEGLFTRIVADETHAVKILRAREPSGSKAHRSR
jgi:hypothetical protein